ncbi:BTB POZ [Fusarium albosuccineum]|uniref:BTB POZ n=1 Tax=Fusarium albosuccineum TaxID=1237068 RepID=A0A8H4PIE8_9HYPO|nr:BTB POZ [Fusarium albosuccineum]
MMNGPSKEAAEKRVSWPGVSVEAFQQFVQFAFAGTYAHMDSSLEQKEGRARVYGQVPTEQGSKHLAPAALECRRPSRVEENSNINDDPDKDSSLGPPQAKASEMKSIDSLPCSLASFCERWGNGVDSGSWDDEWFYHPESLAPKICGTAHYMQYELKKDAAEEFFRLFSNESGNSMYRWLEARRCRARESSLSALTNDAEVYILADKYGVSALCNLSLRRIRSLLWSYVLCEESMGDLVQFVRLIYGGTARGNRARKLISMYFGCFAELVSSSQKLDAALNDIDDFGSDILRACTSRMKRQQRRRRAVTRRCG